ncbi:MAG: hypothetical protein U5K75_11275 [Ahrensia sp.]|nr:hypothetical protein [Ahrensia sp.]
MAEAQATIGKAFREARAGASRGLSITTADLDAGLLLEHACGATTLMRMTNPDRPMGDGEYRAFASYISRRIAREPAHRIIGNRELYGLQFFPSMRRRLYRALTLRF